MWGSRGKQGTCISTEHLFTFTNIQIDSFIHKYCGRRVYFLAPALAWGSLAMQRDCSAVIISLQVSPAPFITNVSPSAVVGTTEQKSDRLLSGCKTSGLLTSKVLNLS